METTAEISEILNHSKNLDDGVNQVIKYLGEMFRVSRVYIFELTDDGEYMNNTYEWCAPGVTPQIEILQHYNVKEYGYDQVFAESEVFYVPDVEDLPPITRDELRRQGIKAMLQCEIVDRGIFRGYVGFDDCTGIRPDWGTESEESLRLRCVSDLLSMHLMKERSLQRLDAALMRTVDEQAQYRNALMKNAIFSFSFDVTEGILTEEFIDRNGNNRMQLLGLQVPCSYDEESRAFQEYFGVEIFDERAALAFSREGILELYSQGKTSQNIEYYQRRDDTYIRVLLLLSQDRVTKHVRATIISFDVTEAKKAELGKQHALRDALAQAERANKAKTTFLNNMSHDIRTPMNAIIGFTALASTHIDDRDRVVEYLKKIQTSSNHLLSLINDVLDMSRIESGKVKIELSEISLPAVMHDIKNIVQADVHAKQLELFFDTVDVIDENVWCDKLRLNQILLNCMSNAIKFTPAGGTIGMRVVQIPCRREGYASYEFHVRDTGIGISPEFIDHIFEPFERERTSTISGIQGTGLGMSITKNIVDMMGGTISVVSEKGKGSEFTISLDLKLTDHVQQDFRIPTLKSVHALVADDNFDTCSSVTGMLRQIGLRPEWTMSGKEAVLRAQDAMANADPFGVYIIDWLMPDMNGIEVVRRIRADIDDNTPIIVLTAYDWTDIENEAREAGVTAFCSKPLFLSELRDLLEKASCDLLDSDDAKAKSEESRDLAGIRILLVEDNAMNCEIAVEILTELGASVDTANDGMIAVERMEDAAPDAYDIILMDVQMPVMDGYEATRRIRAIEERRGCRLPIVAMTANAFDEDRQAAREAGMDGYIAKPINIDNIVETVLGLLKR